MLRLFQGLDVEYVEVVSGAPLSTTIRRREDPVVYTSIAPHPYHAYPTHMQQGMVDPRDYGHDMTEGCMPTTTSLHDLAGALHPVRGHHPSQTSTMGRDEGVSVYGTLRRGGDRMREGGPPHPRAVGTFLATSHQESAV